jgi:hypothetical protein
MLKVVLVKFVSVVFGGLEWEFKEIVDFGLLRSYFKGHMNLLGLICLFVELVTDVFERIVSVLLIVAHFIGLHLICRSLDVGFRRIHGKAYYGWLDYPSCAQPSVFFEILPSHLVSL